MARVEIKGKGIRTEVFVDGVRVPRIREMKLSQTGGDVPLLELKIMATELSIEDNMVLALPEPYRTNYVGWDELIDSGLVTEDQLTRCFLKRSYNNA